MCTPSRLAEDPAAFAGDDTKTDPIARTAAIATEPRRLITWLPICWLSRQLQEWADRNYPGGRSFSPEEGHTTRRSEDHLPAPHRKWPRPRTPTRPRSREKHRQQTAPPDRRDPWDPGHHGDRWRQLVPQLLETQQSRKHRQRPEY